MAAGIKTRVKEDEQKPTRYFSSRQEKAVAKAVGGRTTPNSGATDFGGKSDVLTKDWAIECKTKTSDCDSMSIKKEWIDKLRHEMVFDGRQNWALAFSFGPGGDNYYIIDEALFKALQEFVKLSKEEPE